MMWSRGSRQTVVGADGAGQGWSGGGTGALVIFGLQYKEDPMTLGMGEI